MNQRIRVVNALSVEQREAAQLADIPAVFELEVRPLGDDELDEFEDRTAEVLLAQRPPQSLQHMPALRWTQVPTAGVEWLMSNKPFQDGLMVTNARGVYSASIAEYVLWAVLDHYQKGANRRAGQTAHLWPQDKLLETGRPLRGLVALIVGYGTIGREVARLLAAFGIRVLAIKARPEARGDGSFHLPGTGDPEGAIPELIAPPDELTTLAPRADIVVMTLPLTPASRGIASADFLARLATGALLINVGRGATVDQNALLASLDDGPIGAAYLDVFSVEPLPAGHPLWSHPKAIITPHVSGGGRGLLFELFAENLRRYSSHLPLLNAVSPIRGY
jgi:phosphoglycerate dehydrogenase-like enzyme